MEKENQINNLQQQIREKRRELRELEKELNTLKGKRFVVCVSYYDKKYNCVMDVLNNNDRCQEKEIERFDTLSKARAFSNKYAREYNRGLIKLDLNGDHFNHMFIKDISKPSKYAPYTIVD